MTPNDRLRAAAVLLLIGALLWAWILYDRWGWGA